MLMDNLPGMHTIINVSCRVYGDDFIILCVSFNCVTESARFVVRPAHTYTIHVYFALCFAVHRLQDALVAIKSERTMEIDHSESALNQEEWEHGDVSESHIRTLNHTVQETRIQPYITRIQSIQCTHVLVCCDSAVAVPGHGQFYYV